MPLNNRAVPTNGVGGETGYDWGSLSPTTPPLASLYCTTTQSVRPVPRGVGKSDSTCSLTCDISMCHSVY